MLKRFSDALKMTAWLYCWLMLKMMTTWLNNKPKKMENMKIKEMTMNLVNDGLVSVPWQESQESNYAATRLLCVRPTKSTCTMRGTIYGTFMKI